MPIWLLKLDYTVWGLNSFGYHLTSTLLFALTVLAFYRLVGRLLPQRPGLALAIEDLSLRARSRKLGPDELRGGTFTLTNPGRTGNLYGFAIINQPQVGILRMGELVKRPVVRSLRDEDGNEVDEASVVRPIMHLALSYDHRAVDGQPANAFLHRVRQLIESASFEL